MARKDLLKGLMTPSAPDAQRAEPEGLDPARPRMTKGAIGAVSRSIADLKSRSVMEIDPHLIDAGGMQDRLESDSHEDQELARSIAEYGQQVPVLVRPHPTEPGRYQIVYGRRRVLAMRDLGQPVKALLRDLDDRALVLAQGQENTARRNLSFIEKANFARQMVDGGYERKAICDALSIDKTVISRMLAVVDLVPLAVIESIGAAPSVGRDRWTSLASLLEEGDHDEDTLVEIIAVKAPDASSDARFNALHDYLAQARDTAPEQAAHPRPAPAETLYGAERLPLGQITRSKSAVTLRLRRSRARGFEDWLIENLSEIHRDWETRRGE